MPRFRPWRASPLEVIAEEHPVGQPGQRIVEGVVDELRLEALPVGRVDEQPLRHLPSALGVVRHRVGLVADPDLGAVAGEHPVLRAEGLAGPPVRLVRGDRGGPVVRVDPARPELRIVDELVGPVAEDADDLRAHVGEATPVGHVGIGHVDVDGGGDVFDEHLQARPDLLGLTCAPLEVHGRAAQSAHQDDAAAEDDGQGAGDADGDDELRDGPRYDAGQAGDREPGQGDRAAEQADRREAIGHVELPRGSIHDPRLRARLDPDYHRIGSLAT